jgi:hypothetical protein
MVDNCSHSDRSASFGDDLGHEAALDDFNPGVLKRATEASLDMKSGCISACVQDTPGAVRALEPQRQFVALTVERDV